MNLQRWTASGTWLDWHRPFHFYGLLNQHGAGELQGGRGQSGAQTLQAGLFLPRSRHPGTQLILETLAGIELAPSAISQTSSPVLDQLRHRTIMIYDSDQSS